jgi:hypothetical protein
VITRIVLIALALALAAVAALLVLSLTGPDQAHPDDEPSPYDVAGAQAIGDAPDPIAPDDDEAFLAALEADLTRSRAVRRLTRRLETTR